MKSKQSKPQGISSMLICKMSQGNRPVSLSSEIHTQLGLGFDNFDSKQSTINYQTSQISSSNKLTNSQSKLCPLQQNFNRNVCETLFEEREVSSMITLTN